MNKAKVLPHRRKPFDFTLGYHALGQFLGATAGFRDKPIVDTIKARMKALDSPLMVSMDWGSQGIEVPIEFELSPLKWR